MIPAELSEAFARLHPSLSALQVRADLILQAAAEERGGEYISRLKEVESTYEKLVRGEVQYLTDMEDLLGGTLIFPRIPVGVDRDDIDALMSDRFDIVEVRSARNRRPSEFIYDDLHYLLRLKDNNLLVDKALLRWTFELQVKSYLQHGWAKATHSLVYKGGKETWGLSRLAAETKAIVEVADLALAFPSGLHPESEGRPYPPIDTRRQILTAVEAWWLGELPDNRRRLAVFIKDFVSLAGLSVEKFVDLLNSRRAEELAGMQSISVHQAVIILLLEAAGEQVVIGARKKARFLVITSGMKDISSACRTVPEDCLVQLDV